MSLNVDALQVDHVLISYVTVMGKPRMIRIINDAYTVGVATRRTNKNIVMLGELRPICGIMDNNPEMMIAAAIGIIQEAITDGWRHHANLNRFAAIV